MKTKKYVYGVEPLNGYDAWALFEASARGDLARARSLLAKDPRLVNAQYWYRFPIHLAVFGGHTAIVKLLLDHGADPGQSIYTYDSWDKLLRYARERADKRTESLLERAMQKRFNYHADFDPLKQAIVDRDSQRINSILRRKPELVRASDALGNNAIHWSVITRQLKFIDRFVERGTPIDARRADGQTPLLLAANGALDYWNRAARGRAHPSLRNTSVMVGSLLAHGASYTISVAAAVGDQERVDELLQSDPQLARQLDSSRVSPLSYAARQGHLHIVQLLLDQGADPNLPEDAAPEGRALYEACVANQFEVAKLLLEHGANPNAGVDSSECCLTICRIYHGDRAKPLEELLRQHGAFMPPYRMNVRQLKQAIREDDPVVRHDEFLTVVLASRNRQLLELYLDANPGQVQWVHFDNGLPAGTTGTFVRRLIERGLDPNRPDWLGRTHLHILAESADVATAEVLLDAGARIDAREIELQGTPLAAAVRAWCREEDVELVDRRRRMVEFLIERGANPHQPDEPEWASPLAWAKRHDRDDIVDFLQLSWQNRVERQS